MQGKAQAARIYARQLFDYYRGKAEIAASATVLLGNGRTEKAILTSHPPNISGNDAVLFPLGVVGYHMLGKKPAHLGAEVFVILCHDSAHGSELLKGVQ
jgi:hypothetical protein